MQPMRAAMMVGLVAVLGLSACSRNKDPRLLNLSKEGRGPDAFGVLPSKPLQMPQDLATLPTPTPGGTNRTDVTPQADAVAALGGDPNRVTRDNARASADAGLLGHAGRYGTDAAIRQKLAAEDLAFRRDNDGRLLERVFNVNVYFRAYREQSLDQHAELARWRRAGAKTPAAPPENLPEN